MQLLQQGAGPAVLAPSVRPSAFLGDGTAHAASPGMTSRPTLHCYQYVNRSYDRVRAALHQRSASIFQSATQTASARADTLASTLRLNAAGLEIGVDVHLVVHEVVDEQSVTLGTPVTRVKLGWKAARGAALFPAMEATLSAWPLSADETQLSIDGAYTPPMGTLGKVLDGVAGHRVAEAAVHSFLLDIVEQLRKELKAERTESYG
jgi:hypothetical protein